MRGDWWQTYDTTATIYLYCIPCHFSYRYGSCTTHNLIIPKFRDSTKSQCPIPDSKVHGANMGPTWGRQDPGWPYVCFMNFAIWDVLTRYQYKPVYNKDLRRCARLKTIELLLSANSNAIPSIWIDHTEETEHYVINNMYTICWGIFLKQFYEYQLFAIFVDLIAIIRGTSGRDVYACWKNRTSWQLGGYIFS